jgi:glycosyltransferase involved in cell wall biosynthesis
VKLILAGDGPLKEEILSFVKMNNLDDCFDYVGRISGDAKKEFFESLDTFVLPAIQVHNDMDGIPVVLMEAISYGLPLITTNVSGIPEICTNEYNGFLIEEKNTQELLNAIVAIKSNEKLQKRFSKNSLTLSKEYDIEINSKIKLEMLTW